MLGRAMRALPAQQIWHLLKARAEPARLKFNERKISRKLEFREGTMSRKTTTKDKSGNKSPNSLICPFQKKSCISENLDIFALHRQSEASDTALQVAFFSKISGHISEGRKTI